MNKILRGFYLFLVVFGTSSVAAAQDNKITFNSPYVMLSTVGTKLFHDIAELTPAQRKNPDMMKAIVEHDLMPYIDYRYAAFKVMGSYIRKTTTEQRSAFVKAMYANLVATYANALTQYQHQKVNFEQDRSVGEQHIVVVRSEIVDANAPTIHIDFKLRKDSISGQWKAFDMVVEGISLLSSKQAEITSQIRRVGLQAVIDKLNQISQSV